MNPKQHEFRTIVRDYYKNNKRRLPWRETKNPYHILLSEIMLQQTQVDRVLPKYKAWLRQYPTIQVLHKAQLSAVLTQWSGLGYNRRGKYLHDIAHAVVSDFNGKIPLQIETLETFPGIGEYTARAIYTFSTNKPSLFLETNIRTALIFHFLPHKTNIGEEELYAILNKIVDKSNPREFYYALMDYGNYLKKTKGNSNRQSKKYTRQTKFEGSKRQVRGWILKKLTQQAYLTRKEIEHHSHFKPSTIDEILDNLQTEGFIQINKEKIIFND